MVTALLVPLGATISLAAAKIVLRHLSQPTVVTAVAAPKMPPAAMMVTAIPMARPPTLEEARREQGVNEARLRRDPGDVEARTALVVAAIASGHPQQADMLAREAQQRSPSDPRVWLASARVAQAHGDRGRAMRELERARALRLQQLGYSDNGDDDSTLPAVTLSPGGEPYRGRVATTPRWTPPPGVTVQQIQLTQPDLSTPPMFSPQGRFGAPASLAPAPLTSAPPPRLDTTPMSLAPPPSFQSQPQSLPQSVSPIAPVTTPAPLTTLGTDASGAAFNNPFRQGSSAILPSADSLTPGSTAAASDPMTQAIDRDIAALNGQIDPSVQAGFGFRVRSGTSGLSQLTELTTPLEGEFSPGGYGRVKVSVTPTFLIGGRLQPGIGNQGQFGSDIFGTATRGTQNASGTALDVSYAYHDVTVDVGSTPLGFRIQNVVGGAQWMPKLTDNLTLRIVGERRAVTDSVLAFAGQRDPGTGTTFGGALRSRGRVDLLATAGLANFYAGVGGGVVTGTHIQRNSELEAGAGASYPVYQTDTQEIRVGLDLVYLSYNRNLGGFTLGQGGYFSPQQFFAAIIPVNYREKVTDDLSYEVGAGVGVQTFRSRNTPIFPIDPALQSQLAAIGGTTSSGAAHEFGFAGNAHASVDYRVTPNFHVGARVSVEHAGDYTEGSGLLYGKYVFSQPGQAQ